MRLAAPHEVRRRVAGVLAFAGADRLQHDHVAVPLAELAEQAPLSHAEDLQTPVEKLFHGVVGGRIGASSASY